MILRPADDLGQNGLKSRVTSVNMQLSELEVINNYLILKE